MSEPIRAVVVAAIMTLAGGTLQADVVNLSDGSRIVGTIEQIDEVHARISGTLAGSLTVPRDEVVSLTTEATVTVVLVDGTFVTGRLALPEPDRMVIRVDGLGRRPLQMDGFTAIYREDPLALQRRELDVQASGTANVGINVTSGNTESENLHLDGQLVTRTPRNRYTIAGQYNQEESEDVLVKENWAGLVKYDHFVSDKWFWFNSASFENNEFADLKLRSALAAGMGYQFFETEYRSLSIELGPSYVDENFLTADDGSFFGSRWALDYDQRLWDGLYFFHYNEGLLGLEDTSDLTVRSRTGIRMNVTARIVARIQTAIDWDNTPPADADSTDVQHSLTLGYAF